MLSLIVLPKFTSRKNKSTTLLSRRTMLLKLKSSKLRSKTTAIMQIFRPKMQVSTRHNKTITMPLLREILPWLTRIRNSSSSKMPKML